jgi:hypothetical protein
MTGSTISDEKEQPVSNPTHIAGYFFGRQRTIMRDGQRR